MNTATAPPDSKRKSVVLSEQLDAVAGHDYSARFLEEHAKGSAALLQEEIAADVLGSGAKVRELRQLTDGGLSEMQKANLLRAELIRVKSGQSKPDAVSRVPMARSLPAATQFPVSAVLDGPPTPTAPHEPTPAPPARPNAAVAPTAPRILSIDERIAEARQPKNVRARELARLRKAREGCLGLSTKSLDEQIRKLEETP